MRAGAASTTASTAPTRWAARRRPAATTAAAAPASSPGRGCSSTRRFRSTAPAMPTRGATTCAAARCSSTTCRSSSPEKFVGYRGHPRAPEAVLLRNNGLHVELVFDRTHLIGSRDQAGLADVRLESARHGDHGLRGLGRLRRRRGQGRRLPQLARADEGRPDGDLREGRPAADPQPQPGPDLHRPRRRRGLGQGPRADAGAQRRAPDDQPGDPRPRRRRGLRGADGRDGDDADRAARPEEDRGPAQLGHRLDLRGQAQDARARTKWPSPTRPSPASRRCWGCRATPSSSGSWTRSGAPASTSRSASARRGTGSSSSTPASSTAPATRSTPRWRPGRSAARTSSSARTGSPPTRTRTSTSASSAASPAARRSARACGRCPT